MKLADGTTVHGDAVVLATGVHDELPPVDGLAERWGKSVFNCPFCDGWEHRDQPVVVIDAAPGADHLADTAPFVDAARHRRHRGRQSSALVGDGTDAQPRRRSATDARSRRQPRSSRRPSCHAARSPEPSAARSTTTATSSRTTTGATSHPLVWAAGDVRRPPPMPHQVVLAAADGSTAAIAIHKTFVTHNVADTRPEVRCVLDIPHGGM